MSTPEPKIQIGISELKDMFVSVIQEARKPVVTEREQRELEQTQQERKANAADVKLKLEGTRALRRNCSHTRRDGTTRAVFADQGDHGQFMICQFCQACIRPGERPKDNPYPEHFYNTDLFNKLFQMSGAADILL